MDEQQRAEAAAAEFGRTFARKWVRANVRYSVKRGQILPSASSGGVLLVLSDSRPVNLTERERERREEMGHVEPPNGFAALEAIVVEPTEREARILEIQKINTHAKNMRAAAADDARIENSEEYKAAMEAERAAKAELAAMGEK